MDVPILNNDNKNHMTEKLKDIQGNIKLRNEI